MSDKPISPLRQRMIDDMTARRLARRCRRPTSGTSEPSRPSSARRRTRRRRRTFAVFNCIWRAADQPRFHQRRHRRAAVFFHRDARTARPRCPLTTVNKPRKAPVVEPGGSGAPARSRAGPQVQGRAQRRLRRGPARLQGREPEGVRIDSQRMTLRVEQARGGGTAT